jgi:hypothetical protein
MIVKKHITRDGRLMLAICDSDLKGKKFVEKGLQLDLSSDFYNGEEMDEERILELFKVAYIVNLVGEKSIALGIKAELIEKEHVIEVCKVPHAQCVVVREE